MRKWCCLTCLVLLISVACGGGGSSDGGMIGSDPSPSSILRAGYIPEQPAPVGMTVSLASAPDGGPSSDTMTLEIDITDVEDVFGAAVDVVYDPSIANLIDWSAGSLLESGGQTVTYQVAESQPGIAVLGASRNGGSGVDVVGTRTLIRLVFRVTRVGETIVALESGALYRAQPALEEITGLAWFGGTLTGS